MLILSQKKEKSDYLEVFTLVSQSLSHIRGNNIASVFLRDLKLKFCLSNSIFEPFQGPKCGSRLGQKGK